MRPALLLSLLAFGSAVSAQERPAELWLSLDAGVLEVGPLLSGVGANATVGRTVAGRIALDAADEFTLGAEPTSVRSVSLGGGVRAEDRRVHVEAYAGPALTWGPTPSTRTGALEAESPTRRWASPSTEPSSSRPGPRGQEPAGDRDRRAREREPGAVLARGEARGVLPAGRRS